MDKSFDDFAIVEHSYAAKNLTELDLIKGEIIRKINKLPGGLWEGTTNLGKRGMFPENYVRILDSKEDNQVELREKTATKHRKCKVIFSYEQTKEDELTLTLGDVIEVLGEAEEGWWHGRLRDKIGVFPSNFVTEIDVASSLIMNASKSTISMTKTSSKSTTTNKSTLNSISNETLLNSSNETSLDNKIIENLEAPTLPPKPIREFCRVEFSYSPQNEDELQLNVGDIILIISKDAQDIGWWRGELKGKIGVFPDNFVKMCAPTHEMDQSTSQPINTSKVYIKTSSQNSKRKDSFGSKDSLNDILSETGLQTGNVAAQRISLENKNLELLNNGLGGFKRLSAEIKSSSENTDEKKTPPPVLAKKPIVPLKKSGSVTSVAGNILSGIKSKVKNVEQKLMSSSTSSLSHDTQDGIGKSKLCSQISDNDKKTVKMESIRKSEIEFDNIERGILLPDMRASRVKAPKRRLPSTTSTNTSDNNNSIYVNGNKEESSYLDVNEEYNEVDESTILDNDDVPKVKPKDWNKIKAPWMAELKANQEKKKTPSFDDKKILKLITDNAKFASETLAAQQVISSSSLRSSDIKTSKSNFASEHFNETEMTKSMSSFSSITTVNDSSLLKEELMEASKIRPNSLQLKNTCITSQTINENEVKPLTNLQSSVVIDGDSKLIELEKRVLKLENIIQSQTKIIDELVIRLLRDEKEREHVKKSYDVKL